MQSPLGDFDLVQNKTNKKKSDPWPKKQQLKDALDVFENFRALCQYQMDVGYWATTDFPTKHHLNKLLSIQYMDKEMLCMAYGDGLVEKVFEMIPYCKGYIAFVRDVKDSGHNDGK